MTDISRPLVSVITIVRNGREFIEDTIVSVLSQSYDNCEYIVIDGGSNDGTVEIIAAYADKIKYWVSEKDAGIADAFNKGFFAASGEYIIFLNADDYFVDSNVLRDVVKYICKNDYPMLMYGDCEVIDRLSDGVLYRTDINLTVAGLTKGQMLPQPSLFTQRAYFRKYGLFDSDFSIAMDYEWLLRGGREEKIAHFSRLISRVRNGGVSTKNQRQVIGEILMALRKNNYFNYWFEEFLLRMYFLSRMWAKDLLVNFGLYDRFRLWRSTALGR